MHIPMWVCSTLCIMAPCTIRTLQVQPHSAPASHAERERKGFIRAVWVLTRISNVISVIWSGPRCTEDGDRSCDAPSVAQGWRCMAAQCDKKSAISHIRTLWPLLFLLRASHNIRYSNLLHNSAGWVPPSTWGTPQAFSQSWHFRRVSSVVTSVQVASYAPPHCRRSAWEL